MPIVICIALLSGTSPIFHEGRIIGSQALGNAPAPSPVVTACTLTIDDMSLRNRVGHIQVLVSNSTLPQLSFATSVWLDEIYLPIPVSNVNATDENGNALRAELSESPQAWGVKRVWTITKGSARSVLFRYDISFEYYVDRISSYTGYIGSDYVMGVGAFTFLVPGFTSDRIEVRFNVPRGWAVAAPWEQTGGFFSVNSVEDLATATFGLGNFGGRP